MSEERMRILKMLEEGKINAEDAAKLLASVETGPPGSSGGAGRKMLRVRVMGDDKDVKKVNVNLPLELIEMGLQFVPKEAREKMREKGIELEAIIKMIESGAEGKLVEVDADGKQIIIAIE